MNSSPLAPIAPAAVSSVGYAWPWQPDRGDGIYCNPVIYADYSDPDVVRVGDDFFLTASSFNCTPGLPLLHSRDLVNWTIIGHALQNLPHSRYTAVQPGCGVWAPSIRFHEGRFWIFFPMPDEGIYRLTAEHPAGPWSDPHLVQAGRGLIDPCPLWDEDGRAYLVHAYAGSRAGMKHRLRVCPMAPDGSRLLGEGRVVYHQPEKHPTLEGPKFLKKNGWYYILAPAGGVESGWQVVLRSRAVYGPYEDRIVLHQGSTPINGPHQGALVDTADDGWWFVHFQDAGVYGRVVHLQPAAWQDGWPLIGRVRARGCGEPVMLHKKPTTLQRGSPAIPQTSDDFETPRLGLQWQWNANHQDDWHSLGARPGWLRLFPQLAVHSPSQQPNLLLQKLPARTFALEIGLELHSLQNGEEAGLIVAGETCAMLGIQHGTKNHVLLRIGEKQEFLLETVARNFTLRLEMRDGGECVFAFAEKRPLVPVPQTFQATKGKWIGAKVGLYSIKHIQDAPAGHVDVDYFRFS